VCVCVYTHTHTHSAAAGGQAAAPTGMPASPSKPPPAKKAKTQPSQAKPSTSQASTAAKKGPYFCNKCILLGEGVRLKSEHQGGCPAGGTKEDFQKAEAGAKRALKLGGKRALTARRTSGSNGRH